MKGKRDPSFSSGHYAKTELFFLPLRLACRFAFTHQLDLFGNQPLFPQVAFELHNRPNLEELTVNEIFLADENVRAASVVKETNVLVTKPLFH